MYYMGHENKVISTQPNVLSLLAFPLPFPTLLPINNLNGL
jgi:hypothetical protein